MICHLIYVCVCANTLPPLSISAKLFPPLIDRCQLSRVDGQSLSASARHTHADWHRHTNTPQGDGLGRDKDNSAHSRWACNILTVVACVFPCIGRKCKCIVANTQNHPSIGLGLLTLMEDPLWCLQVKQGSIDVILPSHIAKPLLCNPSSVFWV